MSKIKSQRVITSLSSSSGVVFPLTNVPVLSNVKQSMYTPIRGLWASRKLSLFAIFWSSIVVFTQSEQVWGSACGTIPFVERYNCRTGKKVKNLFCFLYVQL